MAQRGKKAAAGGPRSAVTFGRFPRHADDDATAAPELATARRQRRLLDWGLVGAGGVPLTKRVYFPLIP